MMLSHVTFFPTTGSGTKLFMAIDLQTDNMLPNLASEQWTEVTSCSWTPAQVSLFGTNLIFWQINNRSPVFVPLNLKLESGHRYCFYATEGSALLTGEIYKNDST
jgi:hypothetical protein